MFIDKFPNHSNFEQCTGSPGQDDIGVGEIDEGIEPLVESFGSYLFIYPRVRSVSAKGVAGDANDGAGVGGRAVFGGAPGGCGHGAAIPAVSDGVAGFSENFAQVIGLLVGRGAGFGVAGTKNYYRFTLQVGHGNQCNALQLDGQGGDIVVGCEL